MLGIAIGLLLRTVYGSGGETAPSGSDILDESGVAITDEGGSALTTE